jgi:hypothetical protein
MVREGITTQAILGRVRSHPCRFDLSTDATEVLRQHAVPEVIILAMAERSCS